MCYKRYIDEQNISLQSIKYLILQISEILEEDKNWSSAASL